MLYVVTRQRREREVIGLIEIPDARTIVESQLLETLAEVKQQIASGMTVDFKETYEPPPDGDVSYSGEAFVELLGAQTIEPDILALRDRIKEIIKSRFREEESRAE